MGCKNNIILIILLVTASCTEKSSMRLPEYRQFIEQPENGFRKEVAAGELVYSFQYKPDRYIAAAENVWQPDSAQLQSRQRQLKRTVWFNISVRAKDGNADPLRVNASGLEEYNSRLTYFLSVAERNIRLYYGEEEVPQIGYSFENNYGLAPADVMVVGFSIPDEQPVRPLTIEYYDDLFRNGIVKMKVSREDLDRAQKINIIL